MSWRKVIVKILFIVFGWSCIDSAAQSSIGLSVNYGDRLTFTPNYPSLLLKRNSFSPTLVYSIQWKFRSDFSVIFGGQVGIAGYQLVPVSRDTLGPSGDRSPFADYGIFVSRLEVTPGKFFLVGKRKLFVGLGGGISYYHVFPYTTMGVVVARQGVGVNVFSSYVEGPSSGTFNGFAKLYMRMPISRRLDLAFQYSRHWKSILHGEFEFYHTKMPAAGTIKLVPQGISLILFCGFKTRSIEKISTP